MQYFSNRQAGLTPTNNDRVLGKGATQCVAFTPLSN